MKASGWIRGQHVELELVDIGGGFVLHKPAAEAFLEMENDAAVDGIVLRVNSAFRGAVQQQREWDLRQAALAAGKKYKAVARPGWSTHQSGVSVDLNRAHDDFTNNGIADGATDKWLQANARRYGFVNDVKSEPWHWTHQPALEELLRQVDAA